MDRSKPLKRKRKRDRPAPINRTPLEDPFRVRFRQAASGQGACQNCGRVHGFWEPHHVVYRDHLHQRRLPEWEPRDALRLCTACHGHHHDGTSWRLATAKLRDENLSFAFDALGLYAADYLRRYYDDSTADPRITEHEHRLAA
jgi:5-methylcytosine-specific restriction endonuclease McrA